MERSHPLNDSWLPGNDRLKQCAWFQSRYTITVIFRFLCFCGIFVTSLSRAYCEIEWEKSTFHAKVSDDADSADVHFDFKISSLGGETIVSAKSSCDCTIVEPATRHYAPSETGIISGRIRLKGRYGEIGSEVVVLSIDDNGNRHEKSLHINISRAPAILATPALVLWRINSPAEVKLLHLVVAERYEAMDLDATIEGAGFILEAVRKVGATRVYKIRPASTSIPARAQLRFSLPNQKEFVVYVYIQ